MNHRERVLKTLAHEAADRVPRALGLMGEAYEQFRRKTVQPECMDVYAVKRAWGREVSLAGTVGVQSTLRWGTPAEVKETVRRQCGELGQGGGFILSPANCIEPDVPWENLVAFIEAADEAGARA